MVYSVGKHPDVIGLNVQVTQVPVSVTAETSQQVAFK